MTMNAKIDVTIIVAIYNVEDYLPKCIESLITQTYDAIEILLVDDGSTDGSSVICDRASARDSRVKVIHKQNGGLSDARNAGVSQAMGEYVVFVDGDDVVSRYYVESLLHPILCGDADFSICTAVEKVDPSRYINCNKSSQHYEVLSMEQAVYECLLGQRVTVSAVGKMGRRTLWMKHPFPVGQVYEDLYTVPRLLCDVQRIAYLQEALYGQVIRRGSITRTKRISEEQYIDYYVAIKRNSFIFKRCSSELLRRAFKVRETTEFTRMISLYYKIYNKSPISKSIFNNIRINLREAYSEYGTIKIPMRTNISILLTNISPRLQAVAYNLYQAFKRVIPIGF